MKSPTVGGLWKINTERKLSCVPHSELVLSYVYITTAHKIKPLPAGYWLSTCYNGNEVTKDKLENKKECLFHYKSHKFDLFLTEHIHESLVHQQVLRHNQRERSVVKPVNEMRHMKSIFYAYVQRSFWKLMPRKLIHTNLHLASTYKCNLENSDFSYSRYDTLEIKWLKCFCWRNSCNLHHY